MSNVRESSRSFGQFYFAYRVWSFSKKPWLAIPGCVGSLARTFVTSSIAILFYLEGLTGFQQQHGFMVYIALSLSLSVSAYTLRQSRQ
jgi:hypothetical protein